MFDLPTESSADKRNYRHFRQKLIEEGFLMMQYSLYVKVCPSREAAKLAEKRISAISPRLGVVQSLMVTEKQYQSMHFLSGNPSRDTLNSAERTIII
ncbi:hypothetical protein FC86_GL000509 [Holzapfeliella floricola DSM 23037 = JCM 16512]|uniref:CRISPR-associated endoribonuclease Cas2 n=2 Tax=Holzapfeliella TaxID=2767883 RepID=A0A0R2DIT7_9LACO|nr:hypothetical protein FC86_GL000509 [Holzapfeliella floricola DSM 23037 = JCM 16512]